MTDVNDILAYTANRQYPIPEENWKYYQEWHSTLFFHWKVPKNLIENYIPDGLELDLHNNIAWISLVAFEVKNMRPRNLPPLPYISNFYEINIRTYVIKDGIPGIYLFSIETNKMIEVLLTRVFIGLPYKKSKMNFTANSLRSLDSASGSYLDIQFEDTTSLIEKTNLDLWLSERHSLYEKYKTKIARFDIHHKEWELYQLNAKINKIKYTAGRYNLTTYPDKIQYSNRIDVVLWGRKLLSSTSNC